MTAADYLLTSPVLGDVVPIDPNFISLQQTHTPVTTRSSPS